MSVTFTGSPTIDAGGGGGGRGAARAIPVTADVSINGGGGGGGGGSLVVRVGGSGERQVSVQRNASGRDGGGGGGGGSNGNAKAAAKPSAAIYRPPKPQPVVPQNITATTKWFYKDPKGGTRGPHGVKEILAWVNAGYWKPSQLMRAERSGSEDWVELRMVLSKLYSVAPVASKWHYKDPKGVTHGKAVQV